MIFQRTLRRQIAIKGIGLHTGNEVTVVIRPGKVNQGVRFRRSDISESPWISASYKNVVNTQLATVIGVGKVTVSTIEHLMAALMGLGVDNADVEVSGPELPILDGSSAVFADEISKVGLEGQLQMKPVLMIRRKVELKLAEKWAIVEPSSRLEVHGSVEWDHPVIGYQEFHYVEGKTDFAEISQARTFCQLKDVEAMRRMGLARGGSLENALVVDDSRVLNPEGLRYPNEFARHKVLDALGDFKLAGIQIQGFFRLHRAGHDLHSQLLVEIFKDQDNYEIIDERSKEESSLVSVAAAFGRTSWAANY